MKRWFDEIGPGRGASVYACGPLLPSASQATANANESKLSNESAEIQDFLDKTLAESGEKSLLYVSSIVLELYIPFTTLGTDIIWLHVLACQDTPYHLGVP